MKINIQKMSILCLIVFMTMGAKVSPSYAQDPAAATSAACATVLKSCVDRAHEADLACAYSMTRNGGRNVTNSGCRTRLNASPTYTCANVSANCPGDVAADVAGSDVYLNVFGSDTVTNVEKKCTAMHRVEGAKIFYGFSYPGTTSEVLNAIHGVTIECSRGASDGTDHLSLGAVASATQISQFSCDDGQFITGVKVAYDGAVRAKRIAFRCSDISGQGTPKIKWSPYFGRAATGLTDVQAFCPAGTALSGMRMLVLSTQSSNYPGAYLYLIPRIDLICN